MEKSVEKQTPDFRSIRKTLVGLGNALIQAELAETIEFSMWPFIEECKFECGGFEYEVSQSHPYVEEEFLKVVKDIESYMTKKVQEYEQALHDIECSKVILESVLSR